MSRRSLFLVVGLCAVPAAALQAATISASNSGWFAGDGQDAASVTTPPPVFSNYAVGYDNGDFNPGQILRDFFVFDLTSVTGDIASATLDLYVPVSGTDSGPGYQFSGSSSQEYLLTDTASSISDLTGSYAQNDPTGQAVYNTLGTGTTFADTSISSSDQGSTVNIELDAAALAYLNAGEGGLVSLSGQNPTIDPNNGLDLYFTFTNPTGISGFSQTPEPTLTLMFATPEPASLALMLGGLALAVAAAGRKARSPEDSLR